MVGAHQNLNGSRDLTTPRSGTFCHSRAIVLAILKLNLPTKFEESIFTHY